MSRYVKWGVIGGIIGLLVPFGFGLALAVPYIGLPFEILLTPPLTIANFFTNITAGLPTVWYLSFPYNFLWTFVASITFYVGLFLLLAWLRQRLKPKPKRPH